MNTEQSSDLARRAAVHAALADPARLLITDALDGGRRVPLGAGGAARDAVQPARPPPGRARAGGTDQPPPLGGRPPPQLPAAGPGRARLAHAAGGADGAAGAVRVHRQLGALAPGGGTVAAGQHGPRGLGRDPSRRPRSTPARSPRPGVISCRCAACALGTSTTSARTGTSWSRCATWPARNSAGWRRCTGRSPTRSRGDPGSFDAALDDLGQRVGRLAPRLAPAPGMRVRRLSGSGAGRSAIREPARWRRKPIR